METIKAVGEKIQEVGSKASFEGNKEVAKDSNASIGTRASKYTHHFLPLAMNIFAHKRVS